MIQTYHQLLCKNYPDFIDAYIQCPSLQRLASISLFCGVDYCGLFTVKQAYSRLDHSIGVALILWNFTHDKTITLAGLFHDISTPVFSHVIDFMYKDYLKQEKTEEQNSKMILADPQLCALLANDGIVIEDVLDYKKYGIADNEVPQLSADRLEYMYSTGLFLTGDFTWETIANTYRDIGIGYNEANQEELMFTHIEKARIFVDACCKVGLFFQTKEDKFALEYLSRIVKRAIKEDILKEEEVYSYKEQDILDRMKMFGSDELKKELYIFSHLKKVLGSDMPNDKTIFIDVKKRYIDPLVKNVRSSLLNEKCNEIIQKFILYEDDSYFYIDETCYE